ncbi:MAG: hypothetical protein U9Q98_02645 [Bacteroidota bacterium]|nr:hypothetical protein [Bacteroidota bacterium]
MKTKIQIILIAMLSLLISACNSSDKQNNTKTNNKPEIQNPEHETGQNKQNTIDTLKIASIYADPEYYDAKAAYIEGTIDKVCEHSWMRFKLIDNNHHQFVKIHLPDDHEKINNSYIGKKALVTGSLEMKKLSVEGIDLWIEKVKTNHAGEEHTAHYKEEMEFIQSIKKQVKSGDIEFFPQFDLYADDVEFE